MTKPVAARRSLTVLAATLVVAALTLLTAPSAQAAVYIVTRFDDPAPGGCDPNDCSLREAILAANATLGVPDTINLAAGTYTLTIPGTGEDGAADGDLDVTNDPLTIIGQGPDPTVIDGGGAATGERVFEIFSALDLSGATVRNSQDEFGAGIYGNGPASSVTLTKVFVTGHVSTGPACCGSGVWTEGTASLADVTSSGNQAGAACCAGIAHYHGGGNSGPFTGRNLVVVDNSDTTGCCSGLFLGPQGALSLENFVVSGNHSSGSCCTGLYLDDGPGPTSVRNGTVSMNQADGDCCAGLTNDGRSTTIANVTVTQNRTIDCCAGITHDGEAGQTLTLNNVTVTGNRANADDTGVGEDGGGISEISGEPLQLRNTISFGNTVGTGGLGPDCFGTLTSQGYNLIGSTAGCTITGDTTGNLIGQDPMLGPLSDNGGFSPTHALLKGSPAIDAGSPAAPGSGGSACEATDARGLVRNCDMGAYELTLCQKVAVNRIGTSGKDSLRGTSGPDGILGFGGKDTLRGKGGKDGLCGGPGKDLLKGGAGKDRLNGGPGKDKCVGGPGRDKARACEKTKTIP
ncbi:MAG: choice-of-anchor Q domain-containing protein [Actinomycetota bacterium]